MVDGLSSHLGDIGSESILDASISTADIANNAISGAVIAAGGVAYSKLDGTVAKAVTGSPSSSTNRLIQGAAGTLGAGSDAWVVFPTAFAAAPDFVVATPNASLQDVFVAAGSVNAGSFYAQGETASEAFYYFAGGQA